MRRLSLPRALSALALLCAAASPARGQTVPVPGLVETLDYLTAQMNDSREDRFQFLIQEDDACSAACGYFVKNRWFYHRFRAVDLDLGSFSPRPARRGLQHMRFTARPGAADFVLEVFDQSDTLVMEEARRDAQCVMPVQHRAPLVAALRHWSRLCSGEVQAESGADDEALSDAPPLLLPPTLEALPDTSDPLEAAEPLPPAQPSQPGALP